MADIGLTEVRRLLDEAITYADWPRAQRLAAEGLQLAREKGWTGEQMYFLAQREIISAEYIEAIRFLDLAIKYNPQDGAAYNDRALCKLELGKIDEALPDFDKGIAVEPDYATIYHNKGWLLNQLGQHRQALALFQKALELEPDRAVTYENMADAFVNQGKIAEAVGAYKKALELLKPSGDGIRAQIAGRLKDIENKT